MQVEPFHPAVQDRGDRPGPLVSLLRHLVQDLGDLMPGRGGLAEQQVEHRPLRVGQVPLVFRVAQACLHGLVDRGPGHAAHQRFIQLAQMPGPVANACASRIT